MDFSDKTTEELIDLLHKIEEELAKRESCSDLKLFSNVHDMMHARKQKGLIQVYDSTDALTKSPKTIEVNYDIIMFNTTFQVILVTPIPEKNTSDLLDILISNNIALNRMFETNISWNTPFQYFIDEKCDHLIRFGGYRPTLIEEMFELYTFFILEYIEKIGIDPNSFCPLEINFDAFGYKFKFSGNRTYHRV
jgi:hypothetical protein